MSCEICGKLELIQTCSKCSTVNYCSPQHQIEHWNVHKDWCIPYVQQQTNHSNNYQTQSDPFSLSDFDLDCESLPNFVTSLSDSSAQQFVQDNISFQQQQEQPSSGFMSNSGVFVTLPQPEQVVTKNFCPADSSGMKYSLSNYETTQKSSSKINTMNEPLSASQFSPQRQFIFNNLNRYCQIILKDMNQYGFCVIDDFLQNGDQILSEVLTLYQHGLFRDGQLVSKVTSNTKQIRGDQIIWVDGSEQPCNNIGFLIRIMDSLIAGCNSTRIGQFSELKIRRRTKAMIACYPGMHSKYVRHIDNPNRDGRCITSIYYLNKDYDRMKDGGVLRLFPQMNKNIVADIEPKFNRVIFFWSDRRNPHEVMPSSRMRFAITVWYFDDKERSTALQKYKENNLQYPNDKDLVPF